MFPAKSSEKRASSLVKAFGKPTLTPDGIPGGREGFEHFSISWAINLNSDALVLSSLLKRVFDLVCIISLTVSNTCNLFSIKVLRPIQVSGVV
jgi:hypothetical protein